MKKTNEASGTYYVFIRILAAVALFFAFLEKACSLAIGIVTGDFHFMLWGYTMAVNLIIYILYCIVSIIPYILFTVYVFHVYPKKNTANYFTPIFILFIFSTILGGIGLV